MTTRNNEGARIQNKVAAALDHEGVKFKALRESLGMSPAQTTELRQSLYLLKRDGRASFDGKRWQAC
jgi:hypothetical protein